MRFPRGGVSTAPSAKPSPSRRRARRSGRARAGSTRAESVRRICSAGSPPLIVGVILCALGVIEFTAREHFTGYRSHMTLLAAIPTVGVEFALVRVLPGSLLPVGALVGDAIVFALAFWLLRKRYLRAKQARLARPPRA